MSAECLIHDGIFVDLLNLYAEIIQSHSDGDYADKKAHFIEMDKNLYKRFTVDHVKTCPEDHSSNNLQ